MLLYNSETKQKERLKPLRENELSMYVCGMTVYDYCHIGHARMLITFDMVSRYLRYRGYNLKYVRNITDIEDKIIHRANENGEAFSDLSQRFIDAMNEDCEALNVAKPDEEPRATAHIQGMLDMIQTLLDKDIAYLAENGDVLYDVTRFEGYGRLSHRKLEDMQAGSRVEVDSSKRNPYDFVLWKKAKTGEPAWPSPWGEGRPGWHIECSAMSKACLHEQIDIHGGGADLLFPHHENELAQSEAVNGKRFVNIWMHAGFLNINNEKMSKSLKNFITIREALKHVSADQIRYFMAASHYRSPLNYCEETLANAKQALTRFYTALRGVVFEGVEPAVNTEFEARFQTAMDDDLNTPEAMAVLFDLAKTINRLKESADDSVPAYAALLKKLGHVLGILYQDVEAFFRGNVDAEKIEALIDERNQARADKNFARADAIRDELASLGVVIEDGAGQTTWRLES